jgi:MFS family permease
VARLKMIRVLGVRDYALLWTGQSFSLVGDGMLVVALAWTIYKGSSSPADFALVSILWTAPRMLFSLVGGVAADRYPRRGIMSCTALVRGLAVLWLALAYLDHSLALWKIGLAVTIDGAARAFFSPAYTSTVPELIRREHLPQANALDQLAQPLTYNGIGPALAGVLVGIWGLESALFADAATFVFAILMISAMRPLNDSRTDNGRERTARLVGQGLEYVRTRAWIAGGVATNALVQLVFWGPFAALVPLLVTRKMHGSATSLGIVYGVGGAATIAASLLIGQCGLPRRALGTMYVTWCLGTLAFAGFAFADRVWQGALAIAAISAVVTAGNIIWRTLLQQNVPRGMLGRVASVDWCLSNAAVPISFALTAPAATLFGARATVLGSAVAGALIAAAIGWIPATRQAADAARLRPTEQGMLATSGSG